MKSTLMNPFETCEELGYDVGGDVIAELARIGASGDAVTAKVGGTYLKVLVRGAQLIAGDGAVAVNKVQSLYYPHVLRGVTTADCADDKTMARDERSRRSLERNRRSNFARTAASTLRTWVSLGGDLRVLDAAVVTKQSLIGAISTMRAGLRNAAGGVNVVYDAASDMSASVALNEIERSVARAFKRMVRGLSEIKAGSPERAAFVAGRISANVLTSFGSK